MNQEITADRRPFESVGDYAKRKGVSEAAIYKQIQRETVDFKKIGRQYFVRPKF